MGTQPRPAPTNALPAGLPARQETIGRPQKNERPHPPAGREDTQSIIMSPGHTPADLGKPGCLIDTVIDLHGFIPTQKGGTAHSFIETSCFPFRSPIIHSRMAASRAPAAPLRGRYAPLDPPTRSRELGSHRSRKHD
jgi:hypothetical protein